MTVASQVSPRWEDPRTVAGFAVATPNEQLLAFARRRLTSGARCLDIGCGAARNSGPLAQLGYQVIGTDLARPMIEAACGRMASVPGIHVEFIHAPMTPLRFRDAEFDLVVAHGIWNLARSTAEFRSAVAEAARVAKPGAGLFVFTFSRHTLPDDERPDEGEAFVYSSWNGEPQCFLTEAQLIEELDRAGFVRDTPGPLAEYNRPAPGVVRVGGGPPVIYEGTFVKRR
jgi:ubiquinone/menaquinone biosynthesis C-methylase UbiE